MGQGYAAWEGAQDGAVLRRSPNCKSPNKSKLHGRVREVDAACVACELKIFMEEIGGHAGVRGGRGGGISRACNSSAAC